jgi:hypothetical protein
VGGDASEYIGEPGLRVDVVHLGRDDDPYTTGLSALPWRKQPRRVWACSSASTVVKVSFCPGNLLIEGRVNFSPS